MKDLKKLARIDLSRTFISDENKDIRMKCKKCPDEGVASIRRQKLMTKNNNTFPEALESILQSLFKSSVAKTVFIFQPLKADVLEKNEKFRLFHAAIFEN